MCHSLLKWAPSSSFLAPAHNNDTLLCLRKTKRVKKLTPSLDRDPAFWQPATLLVLRSHPKKKQTKKRPSETPQSPRSYADKLSDKFKWPEEISIHLGPVSSQWAVGGWRPESWKKRPNPPSHDRCISNQSVTLNSECACVCLFRRISQCAFRLPGGRANHRVWQAGWQKPQHHVLESKCVDCEFVCLLSRRQMTQDVKYEHCEGVIVRLCFDLLRWKAQSEDFFFPILTMTKLRKCIAFTWQI